MTFDPSTIIAAILGTPRAQPPSFVPDQAKRTAAMQQRVHQEFRLPPQRRATPAPGPPPPMPRVAACCPRCAMPVAGCLCRNLCPR